MFTFTSNFCDVKMNLVFNSYSNFVINFLFLSGSWSPFTQSSMYWHWHLSIGRREQLTISFLQSSPHLPWQLLLLLRQRDKFTQNSILIGSGEDPDTHFGGRIIDVDFQSVSESATLWLTVVFLGLVWFFGFEHGWSTGRTLLACLLCVNFVMRSRGRGALGDLARQISNVVFICVCLAVIIKHLFVQSLSPLCLAAFIIGCLNDCGVVEMHPWSPIVMWNITLVMLW